MKEQMSLLVGLTDRLPESASGGRLPLPRGILLTGSPGTGKTLLVHALAGSTQVHLISVTPAALVSRWHGEAQRGVRQIFKRAKQIAPCIVFLDELDGLAPARGVGLADQQLVSQLCVELDHLLESFNVTVIGATSRPDGVDPSLLRPGRIDLAIHLSMPNAEERLEILEIHTRTTPLADDVCLPDLAAATQGLVGADLAALCRYAVMQAVRGSVRDAHHQAESRALRISMGDFQAGLGSSHLKPAPEGEL
jgi:transitional endoplasmic reticulum ATPase